jgi:putative SOS response-associated peptidase YedK
MCGRFVSTDPPERLAEFFGADATHLPAALPPSYNVAPTNDVYGVSAASDGSRHLRVFHWGLVPSWAKEIKIGSRLINARAETLAEKSSFREPFRKHRCLVPMSGFYEWKAGEPGGPVTARGAPVKQPYFIHRADGAPLAVAGLWSAWRDPDADPEAPWLHSCTLITTDANTDMAALHDRMPVILGPEAWDEWLDPANHDTGALSRLLRPAPDGLLVMHPVSTAVNQVRNKGPELINPV